MRFGMMGMVTMFAAATAGMAHGEWENRGLSPNIAVVLAQAASSTSQPSYLLNTCADVQSYNQMTAMNGLDPAYMLKNYMQSRDNKYVDLASVKISSLLDGTTHGRLVPHTRESGAYYMYEATQGYKGKDKAVFLAEFEGKTYKIVIDLNVYPVEAIADNMPSTCPPPKLIKLNKPVSEGH